MDFIDLVEARYSVRAFSDKKVEPEHLACILRAGRLAPTGCNNQPQRILVVNSSEGMAKLAGCTRYTFGAPMALLVCYDKTRSWVRSYDQDNCGVVDASIAATHMMLQAADIGLGTTWVGSFDPDKLSAAFGIKEPLTPVAILPLGYPAADARPSHLHSKKLPEKEMVFLADAAQ